MKTPRKAMRMALALSVLSACNSEKDSPKNILNTSPVATNETDAECTFNEFFGTCKHNTNSIFLREAALGQELLLRSFLIYGGSEATFHSLKSRVIKFHYSDDIVTMEESTVGRVFHSDVDQLIILASFPAQKQDNGTIRIDFNKGMSQVYTLGDWYGKDLSGGSHLPFEKYLKRSSLEQRQIKNTNISEQNSIFIEQSGMLKKSEKIAPATIKYMISPYAENKSFVKKESKNQNYFEVSTHIESETEREHVYISHFDISKPIVFTISHNTPKEYISAITEGVLYWNKAFKKNVLQVEVADKEIKAPSFHHNLIQWVDYENAGRAYADMQVDPRTGEALRAHVFLTSAFAAGSKKKTKMLLASKEVEELPFPTDIRVEDILSGKINQNNILTKAKEKETNLTSIELCNHDVTDQAAIAIAGLRADGTSEEQLLEISKHYIRETTAHEIGHLVGSLRHYFAGHQHGNIDATQRKELLKKLSKGEQLPKDISVSSTVMDYLVFEESVINGAKLLEEKALPYDEEMIQQVYFDKELTDKEKFPACTDTDVGVFADCHRFLSGPDILKHAKEKIKENFTSIHEKLVQKIIREKKEGHHFTKEPSQTNVTKLAYQLLQDRELVLGMLKENTWQIKYADQLNVRGGTTYPEYKSEQNADLKKRINDLGGLSEIMGEIPTSFDDMNEKFSTLLEKTEEKSLFTEEELVSVKKYVAQILKKLPEELHFVSAVQIFFQSQYVDDPEHGLTKMIADFLAKDTIQNLFSYQSTKEIVVPHKFKISMPKSLITMLFGGQNLKLKTSPKKFSEMQVLIIKLIKDKLQEAQASLASQKKAKTTTSSSLPKPPDEMDPDEKAMNMVDLIPQTEKNSLAFFSKNLSLNNILDNSDASEESDSDEEPGTQSHSEESDKQEQDMSVLTIEAPIIIAIPTHKYAFITRLLSALSLTGNRGHGIEFGLKQTAALKIIHNLQTEALSGGIKLSQLSLLESPDELTRWILEEEQINKAFLTGTKKKI